MTKDKLYEIERKVDMHSDAQVFLDILNTKILSERTTLNNLGFRCNVDVPKHIAVEMIFRLRKYYEEQIKILENELKEY